MRALIPASFVITHWNSQILSSPCLVSTSPSLSRRIVNPLIFLRRNFLWHPKLLTSCASDASASLSYGGWDDPRFGFDSSSSGESNQLLNLLHSLGIDDRKYMIVFALGFVCAISISRVRFSSIIFFPACAIAVAVGFAIGFVNNDRRVDSFNRRDERLAVSIENLKNLIELFNGFDEKIVGLINGIRRGVDSNRITVSDLENYSKVLESISDSSLIGRTTVEDLISNNNFLIPENQEIRNPSHPKTSKRRKEAEFDPWQLLGGGLFGANMAAAQKPVKTKDTVRKDRSFIDFGNGIGIEDENVRRRHSNNSNSRRFLQREEYRYQKSFNRGNHTNRMETRSIFQQEHVSIDDGHFQTDDWLSSSSSSTSSTISDDMVFNKYLVEANSLVKQAREVLRNNGDEQHLQTVLNNSAKLLSKALDMKPMSLLAIGQLGNTYLLHGELKLKISRELRGELWSRVREGRGQEEEEEEDEMASILVNVCEECEELLVEAGRKYRLALSIDGDDMRALYNWGLALSYRGQLIADIGPEAATDADKIFMAAIDKFDAMISRSNAYAPDALFRWGVALQQRSRLRLRNSKEKIKLLQQAKRLYEDVIDMDSDNVLAKEALYSCISELDLRLS